MTNFICPECLEEDPRIEADGNLCPECIDFFDEKEAIEKYEKEEYYNWLDELQMEDEDKNEE